jgi:hypothetical protein
LVNVKYFWYKVRCKYCNDILALCPPKKNLEANLQNHLGGTKHEKPVLDADNPNPRDQYYQRVVEVGPQL